MMECPKKTSYKYCIVPMCSNTSISTPNKVFFLVPKHEEIRKKWCKKMKRDEIKNPKLSATSSLYCCEDHFNVEEDTYNYMMYKIMAVQEGNKVSLRLKKGILPHKFECQNKDNKPVLERRGALKRRRLELVQMALSEALTKEHVAETEQFIELSETAVTKERKDYPCTSLIDVSNKRKLTCDKAIQVKMEDLKVKYRSVGVNVKIAVQNKSIALSPCVKPCTCNTSTFKISVIKRKLFPYKSDNDSSSMASRSIISSDYEPENSSPEASWTRDESDKQFNNLMRSAMLTAIEKEPKMLLGLPKSTYYLIKLLSDNIPAPTIDILITLKKIKLNDSFSILALHFGYAQSTVSRIFSKTIPLIAVKMKELIVWPEPSEILKRLPVSFRARYSNVVSIIDCFEIQIEKLSDAVHQSLTWSQYKKCNTLKYLISCTPDGLVNYITEGYGGRASDIMIVEDCGYLDCLPPNMAVMADRGFKDLSHLLESKNCTLIRPPSVFKSTASTKDEVKQSKRIAALRIHVEHVINRLREFHMLLPHACVHHKLIPIMDDVVIVACGIINMQAKQLY